MNSPVDADSNHQAIYWGEVILRELLISLVSPRTPISNLLILVPSDLIPVRKYGLELHETQKLFKVTLKLVYSSSFLRSGTIEILSSDSPAMMAS